MNEAKYSRPGRRVRVSLLWGSLALTMAISACSSDDTPDGGQADTGGTGPDGGTRPDATARPDTGTPPSDGGTPEDTGPGTDAGPPASGGEVTALNVAAEGGFGLLPFNSAIFGDNVYIIGAAATGPGIYRVGIGATRTATLVYSGSELTAPIDIDISSDGATLFIADPAHETADALGRVISMSTSGSRITAIEGSVGYRPKGIVVSNTGGADVVYFTGNNPMNGSAGIYRAGPMGQVRPVLEGAPFVELSGIDVNASGTAYVADTEGTVYEVTGTMANELLTKLKFGYPAGIALSQNEQALLISALDRVTWKDVVIRLDLTTGSTTAYNMGIADGVEGAGLHREKGGSRFSWCDSGIGGNGRVYVVETR
jgi:hypothetical protein